MDFLSNALFLALILLVVTYYVYLAYLSNRSLPPGPLLNPFGLLFGKTCEQATEYVLGLKAKYGEICCFRVLGRPCVYLNTHRAIREVFIDHGEVTSARLSLTGINHRLTSGRGLIFNDGFSWQEHRRFVLRTFKDFGFGRGGSEQIIQSELSLLIERFAMRKGVAVDPRLSINALTCNVICMLVFNKRCGDEPEFEVLYRSLRDRIEERIFTHHYVEVFLFKCITRLLPASIWTKLMKKEERIADYMVAQLEEHKASFCNNNGDCLMDAYLKELDAGSHSVFNDNELLRTTVDLFIAGTDTMAISLLWTIYLMALHKETQRAVQSELDDVLHGRFPGIEDRHKLVYTEAVLMEIQRYASVAPLGALPRKCIKDLHVQDYMIPEDALIFANIFAAHRDEAIWPDPHHFNPKNFFDETTNSTRNSDYLIPFNVGRRSCLGESLARQMQFILFTSLLQNFELSPPVSAADERIKLTDDDCIFGNQRATPAFKTAFLPRQRVQ